VTAESDTGAALDAGASTSAPVAVPFKRRLVWPVFLLTALEVAVVALPLWTIFDLGTLPPGVAVRTVAPVAVVASLIWLAVSLTWLLPVRTAIARRRAGRKVSKDEAARAYRATLRMPLRAVVVRTVLWIAGGAVVATFLWRYGYWPRNRVLELAAVAGMHAFVIAAVRGWWLAVILGRVRLRLFTISPPLRRFGDGHFRRIVMVVVVAWAGILGAQAAFLFFFLPVSVGQYLLVESYVASAGFIALMVWALVAWRLTRGVRSYLIATQAGGAGGDARALYQHVQAMPVRLAALSIGLWVSTVVVGVVVLRGGGLAVDDTAILSTSILVVAVAGSIYASLWHRATLRPLLSHLTQRYRVPVRGSGPALSMRSKLLLSFGGVVLLACGMALVWSFVQYKTQATEAVARQADLGLAWLRSEVQAEVAAQSAAPTPDVVRAALRKIDTRASEASAVLYYLDDAGAAPGGGDGVLALGGGPMGAPRLPWYVTAQLRRAGAGLITMSSAELAGRAGRLEVVWRGERKALGTVAVFYPTYRGRGAAMVRPLRELLVFFLALFGICAGIVAATVSQFVSPIRKLERRADGMARGELADPVEASGEGDEIGRLTYALEEMRRALREKLRSTEEVNLDLERAVQMRTQDLARKNRELAETLDKLTQAQAQLVRAEKLASIGQLVAGIAHEINNPVNAIVNTVGPLEEAVTELERAPVAQQAEVAGDIRDMVRVVQRGAQRTKAIVTALHNYSRTDDEKLVDFDVDRAISDSLELLRHLLRQDITVHKRFGDVGKMRGHAGQVNQVLMNLMTNAAQAVLGRPGAEITVETRAEGDDIVVRIADNGPGIPPDVLPRIWDPFFTTKDVGEGTGLGLSIVHELITRHHGTITVETEVGQGTAFVVRLPRLPPPPPEPTVIASVR
jgi:signal transduction histidine kinase